MGLLKAFSHWQVSPNLAMVCLKIRKLKGFSFQTQVPKQKQSDGLSEVNCSTVHYYDNIITGILALLAENQMYEQRITCEARVLALEDIGGTSYPRSWTRCTKFAAYMLQFDIMLILTFSLIKTNVITTL